MATGTMSPKKKAAKKKKKAKKPAASTNGKPAKKAAKEAAKKAGDKRLDSAQKDLPGMESERVPAIESKVKVIVSAENERRRLKYQIDSAREAIVDLFKKHDLNQYRCHGKTVIVEHGSDVVKIKKAKESD